MGSAVLGDKEQGHVPGMQLLQVSAQHKTCFQAAFPKGNTSHPLLSQLNLVVVYTNRLNPWFQIPSIAVLSGMCSEFQQPLGALCCHVEGLGCAGCVCSSSVTGWLRSLILNHYLQVYAAFSSSPSTFPNSWEKVTKRCTCPSLSSWGVGNTPGPYTEPRAWNPCWGLYTECSSSITLSQR